MKTGNNQFLFLFVGWPKCWLLVLAFIAAFQFASYGQKVSMIDIKLLLYDGTQLKGVLGNLNDSTVQIFGRHKKRTFFGVRIHSDSSELNERIGVGKIKSIHFRRSNAPQIGVWVGFAVGGIVAIAIGNQRDECEASISGVICELDEGMDEVLQQLLVWSGGVGLGAFIGMQYKQVEIAGRKEALATFRSKMNSNNK